MPDTLDQPGVESQARRRLSSRPSPWLRWPSRVSSTSCSDGDIVPRVEGRLRRHLLRLAVHRREPEPSGSDSATAARSHPAGRSPSASSCSARRSSRSRRWRRARCMSISATTSRSTKIVFNAAQITAALAAGALVLQLFGLRGADHRRRPTVVSVGARDRRRRRPGVHRQWSADLHRPGPALQDQRCAR